MIKKFFVPFLVFALIAAIILPCAVSCNLVERTSLSDDDDEDKSEQQTDDEGSNKHYKDISEMVADRVNSKRSTDFAETNEVTNFVKISVKNHGDIILELFPKTAPETVKNFKELVAKGFYDGLTFHRVMKNFMIQGGDPNGDGTGGTDKNIKGEFTANGFTNNLKHLRGVISMARADDPNSASCQFFICDTSNSHLDDYYATFGYVIAGMETVDSIASVEVQSSGREMSDPVEDVIIEKIAFVKDNHNH